MSSSVISISSLSVHFISSSSEFSDSYLISLIYFNEENSFSITLDKTLRSFFKENVLLKFLNDLPLLILFIDT